MKIEESPDMSAQIVRAGRAAIDNSQKPRTFRDSDDEV